MEAKQRYNSIKSAFRKGENYVVIMADSLLVWAHAEYTAAT